MSELIVYGLPGSPYVRMPLLACEEKGAPYRLVPLSPGESKTPEHLARQPFGRVPAIEHDGFRLYEADAIIRYIDQAFPGPRLTPADPKAQARMNQVMGIIDWYVMPSLSSGIGFNRIIAPIFGMPCDEAKVAAAIPLARTCIQALEEILGEQRYFAGDQFTLADIMAVSHLEMVPWSPEGSELIAGSPLLAWLDRVNARPAVAKTAMRKMMNLEAA
jgi:glutathione S-transferase